MSRRWFPSRCASAALLCGPLAFSAACLNALPARAITPSETAPGITPLVEASSSPGIIPVSPGPASPGVSAPSPEPSPSAAPSTATPGSSPSASPSPSSSPTARRQKARPRLPAILSAIQANYVRNKTLVAEFTQLNESAALKTKKTSKGRILVKRPDKLRWETLEPERNILVSDGRKFWFYTPPFDEEERGQVIERRSSQVQSKLANALISGNFSELSGEGIRETEPGHFLIQPSAGTAGTVVEARIVVDTERKLIQKVSLRHRDGNTSEITLTRIQLGEPLGDELFSFVPPPNTDVIRE